jgi:hypothetical protein
VNDQPEQENGAGNGRTRSTIAFPYGSLKDAEEIATALRKWGDAATPDQLAGSLNTTPTRGTFRMKVAATRTFGVVAVSRKRISLTELGHRLVDSQAQPAARVEAFLAVPLFKAIFDEYEGRALPPDEGLERKIAELGVSPKQTAKARQALQRSAEQAGFFSTTKGRLIPPPAEGQSAGAGQQVHEENSVSLSQTGSASVDTSLWLKLLDEGESWSADEIKEFVDAARKVHVFLARKS